MKLFRGSWNIWAEQRCQGRLGGCLGGRRTWRQRGLQWTNLLENNLIYNSMSESEVMTCRKKKASGRQLEKTSASWPIKACEADDVLKIALHNMTVQKVTLAPRLSRFTKSRFEHYPIRVKGCVRHVVAQSSQVQLSAAVWFPQQGRERFPFSNRSGTLVAAWLTESDVAAEEGTASLRHPLLWTEAERYWAPRCHENQTGTCWRQEADLTQHAQQVRAGPEFHAEDQPSDEGQRINKGTVRFLSSSYNWRVSTRI